MERFMMYLSMQMEEILPYWALGIMLGSALAVFGKSFVHGMVMRLGNSLGLFGVVPASVLGFYRLSACTAPCRWQRPFPGGSFGRTGWRRS